MLTFVCKATYELKPGESTLALEHEPIYEADQHWSNDTEWSLYAPRDVVPIRPRADVVLVGHAFAPDGSPARSLVARLVVGDIDKSIEVWCDRWFTQDGSLHEAPPFTKMPLLYERAAAGPDDGNPVGMRHGTRDAYGKREIPNLQPPGVVITSPDDVIETIAFGPVAPSWISRRSKLGRHAASWDEANYHHQPLPQDIDASYFNAAPRDQQTSSLRGAERIVLENLHPEHKHLATALSGHTPQAFVERPGRAPQSAPMRPDLLWIHTDRGSCTLTWRGQIPVEHPREAGTVRIALAPPGKVLAWEDVEGAEETKAPRSDRTGFTRVQDAPATGTLGIAVRGLAEAVAAAAVLPFAPIAKAGAPPPRSSGPDQRLAGTPFAAISTAPRSDPDGWSLPGSPSSSQAPAAPTFGPPPAPAQGAVLPSISALPLVSAVPAPPMSPPPMSPPKMSAPPMSPPKMSAPKMSAPKMSAPKMSAPPMPAPPIAAPPMPAPPIAAPPIAAPPAPPPPASPAAAPPLVESPWIASTGRSVAAGAAPAALGAAVAPAVMPVRHPDAAATQGSALSVSNAAADVSAGWTSPRPEAYRPPPAQPPIAPFQETRELLQLIWFDRDAVPRVRRQPSWKRILGALEDEPPDAELDDVGSTEEPVEIEDRREIFEILARGEPTDGPGIQEALAGGTRDDGKFAAPIKLIAGELGFPYDELETLKATVVTVTPLVGNDEALKATVAAAQDFLKLSDMRTAPAVAEGLTTRIREAFAQGKRAVPQTYLDTQVERALLEGRHYQRRAVFGGPNLRALLTPGGSSHQIPAYLPDSLAQKLPMYQRFKARVIAEIHPQVDQYEVHPAALRVVALVRALPPPMAPMR
jgi:hypothetical protein